MVTTEDIMVECVTMEADPPAVTELLRSTMVTCPPLPAPTTRDQPPVLMAALPPGDQDPDHREEGSHLVAEDLLENKTLYIDS